jgi:hypothetical integral membrane protein (TIGR02206 family)
VEHFSPEHLGALAAAALAAVLLALAGRRAPHRRTPDAISVALAAALVVNELGWHTFQVVAGWWTVQESLPVHLCDAAIVVCVLALLTRNQFAYELAYFWGLGGTIQALLTPDLAHAFPSYPFLRYFFAHSGIVAAVAYLTFGLRMRPGRRAVPRALVVTAAYAGAAALLDLALGANYLYLCEKPDGSVLDLFGRWPWYLAGLVLLGAALIGLLYLPYYVADRRRNSTAAR